MKTIANISILICRYLSEIAYACKLGYKIAEIYEAYIFKESGDYLKPFFSLCMREKLRHEQIPVKFQNNLEGYCNYLNKSLGFEKTDNLIKKEDLIQNKCERYFFKDVANFTLGNCITPNIYYEHAVL